MLTQRTVHVLPAVDVLGDESVRLVQGRYDRVSVRAGDPELLAAAFAARGAPLIHVVDLTAAREGRLRPDRIGRIAAAARPAGIQAAGGVRSPADVLRLLEAGATRVVVGTAAFTAPDALEAFVHTAGERLVVALDARGGRLAVAAWTQDGRMTIGEAARRCAAAGVPRVACTAIERDGTLQGPDVRLLSRVRALAAAPVLAAGGIASTADIAAAGAAGCEGVIVGRALLEGRLALDELWSAHAR